MGMEIMDLEGGEEIFHLHLAYLEMFVPITTGIAPADFPEPEFQVVWL